jgi:vanillate O-demethylase ferredoxin subunit
MHELRQGQRIAVSQPRNHFPLVESASRTLLLAAGIGITPILSMARHLASTKRQFEVHYYGRSREEMAFVDELERAWGPAVVHLHVGEPRDKIASSVDWSIMNLSSDSHIYACGPAGFMAIAEGSVASAGFPADQFHREYFQVDDKGNNASNASFEVVLAHSNETFVVAAQESLLAALISHGCHMESSCEQGICGSCEPRVLSGDLDHRDHVLSNADRLRGDRMMACVSRCRGKLILDA